MTLETSLMRAALPEPRSRAVALVFGHDILVCGGLLASGATTGSIVAVNTQTLNVHSAGKMAFAVHDAGAAQGNGRALIFGGGSAAPATVVQRVGPGSPSAIVGQLPKPRADLSAAAIGSEMLVVGGGTPEVYDRTVLTTVDGSHFRSIGNLVLGVRYAAVVVEGTKVYVIGGATPTGDANTIQAVDPASGAVRIVARLPETLSHASAFALGGEVLIAGGRHAGQPQSGIWSFDPGTGAVRPIGHLPYAVSDAATAVVDGVGYLIGGEGIGRIFRSIISISLG
jgi:hypothetical protein